MVAVFARVRPPAVDADSDHLGGLAQPALTNQFGHLDVDRVGVDLVIHEEHPLFLGGQLASRLDPPATGHVNGNGFGRIDV